MCRPVGRSDTGIADGSTAGPTTVGLSDGATGGWITPVPALPGASLDPLVVVSPVGAAFAVPAVGAAVSAPTIHSAGRSEMRLPSPGWSAP